MSKLFVDWITLVFPFSLMGYDRNVVALDSDAHRFAVNRLGDAIDKRCTAHYGYREAWMLKSGGVLQFNPAREDMGLNAVYSGQALQKMPWLPLLKRTLPFARITRLDVTIDVIDPDFDIDALYKLVEGGKATTKSRNVSFITSQTGKTLYVGRRASDRMLRIYDKGGEQGDQTGIHWRIEAELKGGAAQQVAKRLIVNPDEGYAVFRSILDASQHRGYSDAISAVTSSFAFDTLKRRRDTEAWLFGIVARTMAIQEKLNPGTLSMFVKTVQQLVTKT